MAEALDLSLYAKPAADGTLGMDLAVEGVACGACIARIESAVKQLPGVTEARLNFTNRRLHVAWSDGALEPARISQTLEANGYRGHPVRRRCAPKQEEAAAARRLTRCLAVAGFAAMNIMLLSVSVWSGNATDITPETRDFFHWASALIALPAAAYAGRPFFRQRLARACARARSTWTCRSRSASSWRSAMSVVETANHARDAYYDPRSCCCSSCWSGARSITPCGARRGRSPAIWRRCKAETAHRFVGDETGQRAGGGASKPATACWCKPGERVPADGAVHRGASEIDESLVTGETARREVAAGAPVYAGSLNYAGALTLRVTAAGGGALIDEIEKLLEKAASAKSRTAAPRRPRRARLCADGACHRGADFRRLARSPAPRCTTRWSPPSPC